MNGPTLEFWLLPWLRLGLAAALLVGVASLVARRLRRGAWQRTVWQIVHLSLFGLLCSEFVGLPNKLLDRLLDWKVSSAPMTSVSDNSGITGVTSPHSGEVDNAGTTVIVSTTDGVERDRTIASETAPPGVALSVTNVEFSADTTANTDESRSRQISHSTPGMAATPATIPTNSSNNTVVTGSEKFIRAGVWWPLGVWLAGTLTLSMRVLLSLWALRCLRGNEVSDPRLVALFARLSAKMKIRARLLEHAGLTSPVVGGLLRPFVMVPTNFGHEYGEDRQTVMLVHELAHLRHRDPWWQLLGHVTVAWWWWHPLVWWSVRQARDASEWAADEASLTCDNGPRILACCLVELGSRMLNKPRHALLAITGTRFTSSLGRRVEHLLDLPETPWQPLGWRAAVVRWGLPCTIVMMIALGSGALSYGIGGETMVGSNGWRNSLLGLLLAASTGAPAEAQSPGANPDGPNSSGSSGHTKQFVTSAAAPGGETGGAGGGATSGSGDGGTFRDVTGIPGLPRGASSDAGGAGDPFSKTTGDKTTPPAIGTPPSAGVPGAGGGGLLGFDVEGVRQGGGAPPDNTSPRSKSSRGQSARGRREETPRMDVRAFKLQHRKAQEVRELAEAMGVVEYRVGGDHRGGGTIPITLGGGGFGSIGPGGMGGGGVAPNSWLGQPIHVIPVNPPEKWRQFLGLTPAGAGDTPPAPPMMGAGGGFTSWGGARAPIYFAVDDDQRVLLVRSDKSTLDRLAELVALADHDVKMPLPQLKYYVVQVLPVNDPSLLQRIFTSALQLGMGYALIVDSSTYRLICPVGAPRAVREFVALVGTPANAPAPQNHQALHFYPFVGNPHRVINMAQQLGITRGIAVHPHQKGLLVHASGEELQDIERVMEVVRGQANKPQPDAKVFMGGFRFLSRLYEISQPDAKVFMGHNLRSTYSVRVSGDMPTPPTVTPPATSPKTIIQVNAEGKIRVGDKIMELSQVLDRLETPSKYPQDQELLLRPPMGKWVVNIQAHPQVKYSHIALLVAGLCKSGVAEVNFSTLPDAD